MKKKCAIIGTDARLNHVQTTVSGELHAKLFPTMVWNDALKNAIHEFQPQIIFLPIQTIKLEIPFALPKSCEVIFIGKKHEDIERELKQGNTHVFYYLEDEEWIWDNANLTAEGFINYFYLNEKQSIYNKQFIITGYGRVGKRLAFALHHLGAKVIISVRSNHQLFEAKSYGFQIETLENMLKRQKDPSMYLINTIPSKWLDNSKAAYFKQVFDLASNPGCLLDSETNIPGNYALSTSLPGMYFPQDAGYLIARLIQTQLAFLEEEK